VGLALIGLVWLLIWSNTGRSLVQAERLVATAGLLRSDLTEAGYNFFPYHAVAFGWMDGAHLRVVARDTNRAALSRLAGCRRGLGEDFRLAPLP
jgi:hypothetical protein